MRIIGIDPGLGRVGYGIIEIQNEKKRFLDCGVIETNKNKEEGDRLCEIFDDLRLNISAICGELDVDGLRGDIVTNRSARAIAAFEGRTEVQEEDIARVITCSLRHRLRKDPLEQVDSGERVIQAFCKVFDLNEKEDLSKFQLSSQE